MILKGSLIPISYKKLLFIFNSFEFIWHLLMLIIYANMLSVAERHQYSLKHSGLVPMLTRKGDLGIRNPPENAPNSGNPPKMTQQICF